jgi:hypothetical protein
MNRTHLAFIIFLSLGTANAQDITCRDLASDWSMRTDSTAGTWTARLTLKINDDCTFNGSSSWSDGNRSDIRGSFDMRESSVEFTRDNHGRGPNQTFTGTMSTCGDLMHGEYYGWPPRGGWQATKIR